MEAASLELLTWAAGLIRPRKLRTRVEFAEQEVWLDDGPHKGERFKCSTQPWTGLFLRQLDGFGWHRFALLGGTQGGKTFGLVVNLLWHLFEVGETVVFGVPEANMVADKWREDILPVIQATRYAALLPVKGPGSKNGVVRTEVTFQNGATLRFMTGGGGDSSRSGFTSRVSAITEADKMDSVGGGSKETDKAAQIHARTDAYGDESYRYNECTPSFETGLIWQEYTGGTESRIACPCPHCRAYVTPDREHLVGWQDAPTEVDARQRAAWACPACGATLTEADRTAMNLAAVCLHRGQEIDAAGVVTGGTPKTLTFGFRFNSFNNLFQSTAFVAAREWKLSRKTDEEAAERESLQFIWAKPAKPAKQDLTALEASVVAARIDAVPKGRVPTDADCVTVGVDVGKWIIHYEVTAWRTNASPHVVEYGRVDVPSEAIAEELAILNALRTLRDEVLARGWPSAVATDEQAERGTNNVRLRAGLVDGRYPASKEAVFLFCAETPGFTPAEGFGYGQRSGKTQRTTGSKAVATGDHYDLVRQPDGRQYLDVDANHWKGWLHQRLKTPIGQPGSLTLYEVGRRQGDGRLSGNHLKYAQHLLAERQVEEVKGGQLVVTFEKLSQTNHWLDATALSCVAGHVAGVRLMAAAGGAAAVRNAPAPAVARPRVQVSDWIKRR